MSDERETPVDPGAPVEEQAATDTAVQDAVVRATAISEGAEAGGAVRSAGAEAEGQAVSGVVPGSDAPAEGAADAEAQAAAATVDAAAGVVDTPTAVAAAALAEQARREQAASIDTQLDLETPAGASPRIAATDDLPSAAAAPAAAPAVQFADEARDGEIRISADHPMAALYMQSPMPPDLKGNRGAGVLISLLATVVFAALYAGVISVMLAPRFPASTFLTEGLLPWVTSWGFIAGVVAFFVGMIALVLIFGRAGWWAYVIFSLFVAGLIWVATSAAFAITPSPFDFPALGVGRLGLMREAAMSIPALGAAIVGREVAIWFGAWIGARGRRITARNAQLLEEYEVALAEVRAKQ